MKTCDAQRDDFSLYFDRQMDEANSAAFEAHQNDCGQCKQEYERFSAASEKLAVWINSTSLLAGGEIERKTKPKTLRWPILDWVVAGAAAILLVVCASEWMAGIQETGSSREKAVAEDNAPPKAKTPSPDREPSDGEIKKVLDREIPRLSSNDFKEREEAQAAIVKLGIKAEAPVEAALKTASDAEVRSRLQAVLQAFAVIDEDAYALGQIKKGESFPHANAGEISLHLGTVADVLAIIERQSNLKIEFYPKDKALARMAEQTQHTGGASFGSADSAHQALVYILNLFDASFVLDEGKVVIVRMTPAVFFAKLEQQFPLPPANEVDDRIVRFEGHPYNHWLTVMRFLQIKCEQGEESRKKWLEVLISRANDNTATEEHRAQALHAMTSFLGLKDRAQVDVDGTVGFYAIHPRTPREMRHEAMSGLVMGMCEHSQSAILTMLEQGDQSGQLELLQAINDRRFPVYSGLQRILHSKSRAEQFYAALRKLSKSDDVGIAVRALSLLADFNDAAAIGMLAGAPQPKDRTTKRMFIEALSRRDNETCAPLVRGKGRERLDAYAKDPSEDVRAIYACRLGYCAGGPERLPDVEALLPLLQDPSPLVRGMSVESLGVTYSASAATLFREKLGEVRRRLTELKQAEQDPRVIRQIDESLKGMLQE